MCDGRECDWKKADPRQLVETIHNMKAEIESLKKIVRTLEYSINELLLWKRSSPPVSINDVFNDDNDGIPF